MAAFLPENHLDAPLLISMGTTSGSGFLVQHGDYVCLATAKHVLLDGRGAPHADIAVLTAYTERFTHKVEIELDIAKVLARNALKAHPQADLATIRLGSLHDPIVGMELLPGLTVRNNPAKGGRVNGAPSGMFRRFDDIGITN